MTDLSDILQGLAISGIGVSVIVLAVTECIKSLFPKVDGKGTTLVAMSTGAVVYGLALAIEYQLIPADALIYVYWAVGTLIGGLTAGGFFMLGRRAGLGERPR